MSESRVPSRKLRLSEQIRARSNEAKRNAGKPIEQPDTFDDLREQLAPRTTGFAHEVLAADRSADRFTLQPEDLESSVITTTALRNRIARVEEQLRTTGETPAVSPGRDPRVDSLELQLHDLRAELERSVTMIRTERMSKHEALAELEAEAGERQHELERRHAQALAKAKRDQQLAFSSHVGDAAPVHTAAQPPSDASQSSVPPSSPPPSTATATFAPTPTAEHVQPGTSEDAAGALPKAEVDTVTQTPLAGAERDVLEAELDQSRQRATDLAQRVTELQVALTAAEQARAAADKARLEHERSTERSAHQLRALQHQSDSLQARLAAAEAKAPSGSGPTETAGVSATNRRATTASVRPAIDEAVAQTKQTHRIETADLLARHNRALIELQAAADERLSQARQQFESSISREQERRQADVANERKRRRKLVDSTSARLNAEITDLKSQLESMRKSHATELAGLGRAGVDEQSNRSATSRAAADQMQALRTETTLARAAQATAETQRDDVRTQLTAEITALNDRLNSVHAEINQLRTANKRLVDENAMQATRLHELAESSDERANDKIAEVSELIHAAHRTELAQAAERHAAEISRVQAQASDALSAARHDHETALEEQRRSHRSSLNAEHDRVAQAVERAEARFEAQLVEAKRSLTATHQSELADERRRTEGAHEQVALSNARIAELEAQATAARHQQALLQQQISDAQAPFADDIRQLTERLAASEARADDVRRANAELRQSMLVERANVAQKAAEDQRALRGRLQGLEQRLASELERVQSAHRSLLDDATDRLASASQREAELEAKLDELTRARRNGDPGVDGSRS